jgi:hypothetical protein
MCVLKIVDLIAAHFILLGWTTTFGGSSKQLA